MTTTTMVTTFCDRDALRTKFSTAMSDMYKQEVPSYAELIDIVTEINSAVVSQTSPSTGSRNGLSDIHNIHRLTLERHGAIRLGTPFELSIIRRLFSQFGMYPVGYYDLSVAGLPLHATAFRPTDAETLERNPFRVFTTLFRPDLLRKEARDLAKDILSKRNIFPDRLLALLEEAERKGGVELKLADEFVKETLEVFRWHDITATSHEDYQRLNEEHPLLADIASFRSAHINHLTPRTLDIDQAQIVMGLRGLEAKERIEGPPSRKHAILLRQTSFKAIHEKVRFKSPKNGMVQGIHAARFGEIEQRGAALTHKGRELYDKLLTKVNLEVGSVKADAKAYDRTLKEVFAAFPDDRETLREQGLVFCSYQPTHRALETAPNKTTAFSTSMSELLDQGFIDFEPLTYEDFLPFSAAGIFRSNLGKGGGENPSVRIKEVKKGFEECLGSKTLDSMALYAEAQQKSLDYCSRVLKLENISS
ncbi:uncharacterized protein GIQ15_02942 [Arthroderma uncinatum]|uniref:uncharacterized protein n=1 Tax=Arthroderma uncinatum TaxID=74035 RepID=UPI00144ABEEF|nr:uncharacterized protein GIQ15_02942 [Arthroderma uncinatum]KAF3483618.1 hypothetical protein GIQ15_02942 [Arthroderma uncinatum]